MQDDGVIDGAEKAHCASLWHQVAWYIEASTPNDTALPSTYATNEMKENRNAAKEIQEKIQGLIRDSDAEPTRGDVRMPPTTTVAVPLAKCLNAGMASLGGQTGNSPNSVSRTSPRKHAGKLWRKRGNHDTRNLPLRLPLHRTLIAVTVATPTRGHWPSGPASSPIGLAPSGGGSGHKRKRPD